MQHLAKRTYLTFRSNHSHPSLHFKKVGRFWSARVGLEHRALAVQADDGLIWVWIGPHDEYEKLINS